MSSTSHFPFLLSTYICRLCRAEKKKKSRPTSQDYIFAMGDSGNFRCKTAVAYNVFRLTRTKHSKKCLWFLPQYEWSPEWLNIMERPICWRWRHCHGGRWDWIGLLQGLYETRNIWICRVTDRWRKLHEYERSDHLLKTRVKPHEILVVVTLV